MSRCSTCGRQLDDSVCSCPYCGGTVIPGQAERAFQSFFCIGDLLEGRFRVESVLGSGASGVVYGVHDILRDDDVALKVLWEQAEEASPALERLRREIRASQKAPHPSLVAIHDFFIVRDHPALVMEWVKGETLRDKIRREGSLPFEEALAIITPVIEGLNHLHGLGIVHRDVKSSNILLDANGGVKTGDFGLAKGKDLGESLTRTGSTLGTPGYMAPEVIRGEEATPASDMYGVGCVLFEMLTGQAPFKGASVLEVASRQLSKPPPLYILKKKKTPRWLRRLLGRIMKPNPKDRPSAEAIERALQSNRFLPRVRLRWLAAALFLSAAFSGAFLGYRAMRRGATVRFQVSGEKVSGLDKNGRITWTKTIPSAAPTSLRGDLDGDGKSDIVLFTKSGGHGEPAKKRGRLWLRAISLTGRRITSVDPMAILKDWAIPFSRDFVQSVWLLDLDRDGVVEIVVVVQHRAYYPAALLVYWPRWNRWDWVLNHPGHIYDVASAGVKSNRARLVFLAINNRLCMTRVLGVEDILLPPMRKRENGTESALNTPNSSKLLSNANFKWEAYVPFEEAIDSQKQASGIAGIDQQTIVLRSGGTVKSLDRFFNPVPGPNAGRDLSGARLRVMTGLCELENAAKVWNPGNVRTKLEDLRKIMRPLLNEAPYRSILALKGARALAQEGETDAALAFLRKNGGAKPYDDVLYEEATLLASMGRLRESADILQREIARDTSVHASFDAPILLERVAIELGDRTLVGRCVDGFTRKEGFNSPFKGAERISGALLARAHLWWDDVSEADCSVVSTGFTPAGDAWSCLARWRLGRIKPEDPKAMERLVDAGGGAESEHCLALAAAQLGLHRPRAALATLERLKSVLKLTEAVNFSDHQLLDLCLAMHARALLDAGEPTKATSEAALLLKTLKPGFLPAKLCKEVLASSGRN